MKLTNVVAKHGFVPSALAQINNAKLYERNNSDGVTELLCVQKIGKGMRVDRMPLLIASGLIVPIGEAVKQILPISELEGFLDITLKPAVFN